MLQVENCFPPLRATHPRQIGYVNLKGEIVDRSNERTQQEAESNLNKVHKTTFNCGFGFAVMLLAAQCDVCSERDWKARLDYPMGILGTRLGTQNGGPQNKQIKLKKTKNFTFCNHTLSKLGWIFY